MKRSIAVKNRLSVLLLLLAVICCLGGFGYGEQRIFDEAGLFTQEEEAALGQAVSEAVREGELDVAILTVNSTGGRSAMDFADDFYDENGFGYGDDTGILLLINMGEREVWISTAGMAVDYFTDSRIDSMVDAVTAELSDGDYYRGALVFVQESAYYMYREVSVDEWQTQYGGSTGVYDTQEISSGGSHTARRVLVSLAAALVAAGVTVFVMYRQEKGRMTANSHTYLKDNRYALQNRQDIYTHTTTITRRLNNTPPPGARMGGSFHGRGGVHVSGGGMRHGGGGGRF